MNEQQQKFLTPRQLTERWQGLVSIQTLANWRHLKYGPSYTKIGVQVIYPIEEVEKWEKDKLHGLGKI